MADESDKQDSPPIPPKLNLRKQGILKQEPTVRPPSAPKQETSRLVVQPAQANPPTSPAEPSPAPAPAASTPAAAPRPAGLTPKPVETPAVKLQPLKPKPIATPVAATAAPSAVPSPTTDPTKVDTKRKTARIPLEQAKPAEAEVKPSLSPKTIKIRPVAPIPKIRATQPLSIMPPMDADEGSPVHVDAEKRKTSRIPLEEALTADKESDELAEPADPARPKTIKIKRPGGGESATVRIKTSPEEGSAPGEMGKTARLDTLALEEPDATPTQKKTIRVRRPDAQKAGAPGLEGAPSGVAGLGLRPPEPEPESDEPGAVWAILGIAATLTLCVVIYLLAAQAFGPNVSGTQLSSWKDGPNLSWPGKILN